MGYGARVSRVGFDAKTCADFETFFDSAYPNLKIAFEGSFTTTTSVSDQTIVTHSLGYAPVFVLYIKDKYGSGNTILARTGYSQYFGINSSQLIYNGGAGDDFEGYYYIYHQRIDQNINYSTVSNTPTTPAGTVPDYAIRVSKPGFNVNTASPRDLAWSSEYPTLIIHRMVTGTLTSAVPTSITHGLPYFPQFFFYLYDINGDSRWTIVYNSFDAFINCDNTSVYFGFNGVNPTYNYGIMILKDPVQT